MESNALWAESCKGQMSCYLHQFPLESWKSFRYDNRGLNLIHVSTFGDNPETTLELIKAGFDVNHPDVHGNTPLHRAMFNAQANVLRVLLENGGDANLKNNNKETPLDYYNKTPSLSQRETQCIEILKMHLAKIN